jgi:hypothetical protein
MSGSLDQNRLPTIADLFQLHEDIARAVANQLEREKMYSRPQSDAIFYGMTQGEIDNYFLRLDRLAMFDLLSTAEAHLRLDFNMRVDEKRKDALSRHFREVSKHRRDKIRLEEDILRGWGNYYPEFKSSISHFKSALKLRNWLAHGQCWVPKLGRSYTKYVVRDICDYLLNAVISQL